MNKRPPHGNLRDRAPILAGGISLAVVGVALWWWRRPPAASLFFNLCVIAVAAGTALAYGATLASHRPALRFVRWISTSLWMLGAAAAVCEAGFRIANFDFETITGPDPDADQIKPLCFRRPNKPLDEVFFQRFGPQQWRGRPLNALLRWRHSNDAAYTDEKEFTLSYDSEGFRNPPGLRDWDIVVAGDSYTELGFLPPEDITTHILADRTGLRVKNLGMCGSGAFSHAHFLQHFGGSASCRTAVLAFYEANQVTAEEWRNLQIFKATGRRPLIQRRRQTSFLRACYRLMRDHIFPVKAHSLHNAFFVAAGKHIPIMLHPEGLPPNASTIPPPQYEAWRQALDEWARTARALGMKPWLMYIPANFRVYAGWLQFAPEAPPSLREWQPDDLPALVAGLCHDRGISFVDATPRLRKAAEQGTLLYNPIYDSHFNREGARIAGEVLADALAAATPQ